jgi:hypothetical protein
MDTEDGHANGQYQRDATTREGIGSAKREIGNVCWHKYNYAIRLKSSRIERKSERGSIEPMVNDSGGTWVIDRNTC